MGAIRGHLVVALVCLAGVACGLGLVGEPADDERISPAADGSDDVNASETSSNDGNASSDGPSNIDGTTTSDASDASDATTSSDVDSSISCPTACTSCAGNRCNITCPG